MPAITTSENDIKDLLSRAFLRAVAAKAGCQVTTPELDRNSIDATIEPAEGSKVRLDVQLKATSHLELSGSDAVFDLPIKNYDDLRNTEVESAQILVVLRLPERLADALSLDEQALIMRHSAYWRSLYGEPASRNRTSIRVHLPRTQVFTPEAHQELIERRLARLRGGVGGL